MKNVFIGILVVSLIANLLLTLVVFNKNSSTYPPEKSNAQTFPYLSKRIFVEDQNDILINFIPLREAMREYISKQKDEIAVYFEYLPSGTSIGVNEKMEVRLASLIKLPIVMAAYKQIGLGRLKKDQTLTVSENDINKLFGDLWKMGPGTKITVDEAVRLSLIASDNTAARTLVSALPEGTIDDVFDSLDIPKDKVGNLPVISPKSYTSILRSLYLSSYLTKEASNEILDLLSRTNFNDMLPAGVEPGIKVAHKIGVFDSEGIYSDCGIVYVPNRPYALCIMVRADEKTAKNHMILLSKMAFGYVAKVNR